jgi:hypothetical protein
MNPRNNMPNLTKHIAPSNGDLHRCLHSEFDCSRPNTQWNVGLCLWYSIREPSGRPKSPPRGVLMFIPHLNLNHLGKVAVLLLNIFQHCSPCVKKKKCKLLSVIREYLPVRISNIVVGARVPASQQSGAALRISI